MEPLNEQELAAVKELRGKISDVLPGFTDFQKHDLSLGRFIRARDLDVEKAHLMFRNSLAWRRDNDIDNLRGKQVTANHETDFPIKVCGVDKRGLPVLLAQCGRWDFRKAMEAGEKESFISYVVKFFEQLLPLCESLTIKDKFISQVVAILDFEGFAFRQLTSRDVIEAICEIVRTFEANYPELLRVGFIINAPTIFQILWAVIKPMLTKRTLAKIHIIGNNKQLWRSKIFKIIDPNNFPSMFGGGVNISIDYKFIHGLDVFKTYPIFPTEELRSVEVGAGQKYRVDVMIYDRDSQLSWNFTTDHNDIGFSVEYEDDNDSIVTYCRVEAHQYVQRGTILCRNTGHYTLTFDNSYSSYRGKTVRYAVRQTPSKNNSKLAIQPKFIETNRNEQSSLAVGI